MTNNLPLFLSLINRYNKASYTHQYIFGFTFMGNVYMAYSHADMLSALLILDKASRGAGYSIRFKPNKGQKAVLLPNAEILCSVEFFEDMVANSKYNRGEIFEKLVTEKFGQVWVKDNVPFTDDGDVTYKGVAYQIKFEKATFANEKSLALIEG